MIVPGACYVGRSLTRRYHKRKVKVPKIKYGVPVITEEDFKKYKPDSFLSLINNFRKYKDDKTD